MPKDFYTEKELPKGTKVRSILGKEYQVIKMLDKGGEATVYAVRGPDGECALKVYHDGRFSDWEKQYDHLIQLMNLPFIDEAFVMPVDIVYNDDQVKLGSVMELVKDHHKLRAIMDNKVDMGFKELALVGYHLSKAIYNLHKKGYVYMDINNGNILISESGHVRVVDCENISINGDSTGIGGTLPFMSPEIMCGEKNTPSRMQEYHSLACFLFMLLCSNHPYMGALESKILCLDKKAEWELLAHPVYLFDEQDTSNHPIAGVHDPVLLYYPMLPKKLKDLFYRSLCVGIERPSMRTSPAKFMVAFQEMYLNIVTCDCEAQSFYKPEDKEQYCWCCGKKLDTGMKMKFRDKLIRLYPDLQLPKSVFTDGTEDEEIVIKVTECPTVKGLWGITNETDKSINLFSKSGNHYTIKPHKSASISEGCELNIVNENIKIVV